MQNVDEVIKGLEYLSDVDKERILKARGIEMPEISTKAQHKIEREDSRKAEEQTFMNGIKPDKTSNSNGMKIHIEISSYGKNGDTFHLEGDIYNQDDLTAIHERFKEHMPRKRFWGLI